MRVKEAAEMLGLSPNTIRAWGAAGKISEHRHPVNNYRLYKQADLRRLLRKMEQPVVKLEKKTKVVGRHGKANENQ